MLAVCSNHLLDRLLQSVFSITPLHVSYSQPVANPEIIGRTSGYKGVPMTLMYDLDLHILKMYPYINYQVSIVKASSQNGTDRQTDATELITTPHLPVAAVAKCDTELL